MVNNAFVIALFVVGCLVFNACNLADSNAEKVRQLNPSAKFIKDIPKERITESLRTSEKDFGLDSLDNGFDSIQIRIWYGCALLGERLVMLTHSHGKWEAKISDSTYYDSIPRVLRVVEPCSSWEKFIKSLFDLEILSLPAIDEFGTETFADGCGAAIEIATKKVYRVYVYSQPDFYEKKHWQAKNMISILRLINTEFGIKNWWPSEDKIKKEKPYPLIIRDIELEEIDTAKIEKSK